MSGDTFVQITQVLFYLGQDVTVPTLDAEEMSGSLAGPRLGEQESWMDEHQSRVDEHQSRVDEHQSQVNEHEMTKLVSLQGPVLD